MSELSDSDRIEQLEEELTRLRRQLSSRWTKPKVKKLHRNAGDIPKVAVGAIVPGFETPENATNPEPLLTRVTPPFPHGHRFQGNDQGSISVEMSNDADPAVGRLRHFHGCVKSNTTDSPSTWETPLSVVALGLKYLTTLRRPTP